MNILDILILVLFLVIIAVIGYKSTKKIDTTSGFTLADRKLTKLQASLSLAASDMGGSSIVGASAYVYAVGIAGAWWNIAAAPAFLLLGFLVTRKLRTLELTTVPEFLGKRYSKRLQLSSSILHIIGLTIMVSSQFVVAAATIHVVCGVSQNVALIIALVIVLLYTTGGGLIAVVNTDVFQFFIMMFAIIMLIPFSLNQTGGISNIVETLDPSLLSFSELGFWTPFSWFLMALFTYGTNQAYLQRVFASKTPKTASFAFNFTGMLYVFYGLAIGLLGLVMIVVFPGLEDPNLGFALLITEVLPNGLIGIALGGLFAATMSSADSLLIGASSMIINDIYKPLKKDVDDKQVLKLSRITVIIVAVTSIGVSTLFESIVDIVYVACLLYSAVVFCPFILGVFNKKITTLAAELAMATAFIVGIISEFFVPADAVGIIALPSNVLCASSSIIVLLVVSYLFGGKKEK